VFLSNPFAPGIERLEMQANYWKRRTGMHDCRFGFTGQSLQDSQGKEMKTTVDRGKLDPGSFLRSKKGNLWRTHKGKVVSVFKNPHGLYSWSIADSVRVRFSRRGYRTEEYALKALIEELGEMKP